jgi:hypothetical protein
MPGYIFDGVEVRLTGKRAVKRSKPTTNRRGQTTESKVVSELVEIETVDPEQPHWKKWVDIHSLYEIVEDD